ncbi:MAG: methylmalonyl-CoA epimerase [Candidatus Tectomicrobia bacterium]|nr:methylmalonyl-CoA epimerase [Candidatus Tectomicrobia bacterium]
MLGKIHHIGIVVRSLDEAYGFYRDTLSLPVHKEAIIQDQGVRAALLTIGESEIELLEPVAPDTGVARFLAQRGEGLHHLCFQTDDIDREIETARRRGVTLIDQQPRTGLAGTICFLHPKSSHGVLIEYAQP